MSTPASQSTVGDAFWDIEIIEPRPNSITAIALDDPAPGPKSIGVALVVRFTPVLTPKGNFVGYSACRARGRLQECSCVTREELYEVQTRRAQSQKFEQRTSEKLNMSASTSQIGTGAATARDRTASTEDTESFDEYWIEAQKFVDGDQPEWIFKTRRGLLKRPYRFILELSPKAAACQPIGMITIGADDIDSRPILRVMTAKGDALPLKARFPLLAFLHQPEASVAARTLNLSPPSISFVLKQK